MHKLLRIWGGVVGLIGMLALVLSPSPTAAAQANQPYAALLTVTYEGVEIRRADTEEWLPLPPGAQTPFGEGDRLRTLRFGRAKLDFLPGEGVALVLPRSELTLNEFGEIAPGRFALRMSSVGRSVYQFPPEDISFALTLAAEPLALTADTNAMPFRLALENRPSEESIYAVVGEGDVSIDAPQGETVLTSENGYRWQPSGQDVVSLTMPSSFAHVEAALDGCPAPSAITTAGGVLLRVRAGPGTGFFFMGSIQDSSPVTLMGQARTSEGLWYRIRFLNDFGWVLADAITTDCAESQIPEINIEGFEVSSGVVEVQPPEVGILEPFFGPPREDVWFYRVLNRQ